MSFVSEPGFYKEGHFGIRLENVLEVVKKEPRVSTFTGIFSLCYFILKITYSVLKLSAGLMKCT